MLETLDYTIRIGSIPTFLYFDLYPYSAYAAHFVFILGFIAWSHDSISISIRAKQKAKQRNQVKPAT